MLSLTSSVDATLSLLDFDVSLKKSLAMSCFKAFNDAGFAISKVASALLDQGNGSTGDLTLAVCRKLAETIDQFQETLFKEWEMIFNSVFK